MTIINKEHSYSLKARDCIKNNEKKKAICKGFSRNFSVSLNISHDQCIARFFKQLLCLIKAQSWLMQNFSDYFWDYFSGATGHHDHSISAIAGRLELEDPQGPFQPTSFPDFLLLYGSKPCARGVKQFQGLWCTTSLKPAKSHLQHLTWDHIPVSLLPPQQWWELMAAGGTGFSPGSLLAQEGYHQHVSPLCKRFINTI